MGKSGDDGGKVEMVEQSGGDGEKWRWWSKVEVMGKSGDGGAKWR